MDYKVLINKNKMVSFLRGLKLKEKYLGPHKVNAVKVNDCYELEKVGINGGHFEESRITEYLKPWAQ